MSINPDPRILDDLNRVVKPLRLDELLREIIRAINALGSGGSSLTIEEVDGTPTGVPTKLVLPNGTLTIVAGVATYTPAGAAAPTPSVNNVTGAYQFVAADYSGLVTVRHPPSDTTGRVWTIPLNATVAQVAGSVVPLRVAPAAGAVTLTPAGGFTLYAGGNSSTGPRVLAPGADCVLHFEDVDIGVLTGTGWT